MCGSKLQLLFNIKVIINNSQQVYGKLLKHPCLNEQSFL